MHFWSTAKQQAELNAAMKPKMEEGQWYLVIYAMNRGKQGWWLIRDDRMFGHSLDFLSETYTKAMETIQAMEDADA